MRFNRLALLGLIFIASCGDLSEKGKSKPNSKNTVSVYQDDDLINKAIDSARKTFPTFDSAFRNGNYDTAFFAVKVRFDTKSGGEHIWAHSITLENGIYYGTIDEDAINAPEVKAGDRIKITLDNLTDWVYSDEGIMRGGFTIKALRNRMTIQQRIEFDSTYYLKIVD